MYAAVFLAAAAAMSPLSSVHVTSDDQRSIMVSAADLDLARPADAKRFSRRLATAVRRVCTTAERVDISRMSLRNECMRFARDGSGPQVERMIAAATARRATQVAAR